MSQAKIAVIYYSTYGHISKLTEEVVAGAKSSGAHVDVFQIPETLSADILAKQHAIPRPDIPVINPHQLTEYDGFIFGFPTRFGRAPAQVSAFFDSTGTEWASGALVGKFATVYTSVASQHGGLETTALTTVPFFVHHGIAFVPTGYASLELSRLDEIIGGSAYGAGTVAGGDGSRQPTEADLKFANAQGTSFSKLVSTFVAGKAALASATHGRPTIAAETLPASATSAAAPAQEEPKAYIVDGAQLSSGQATTQDVVVNDVSPTAAPTAEKSAVAPAQKQKKSSIWARFCGSEKDYAK